MKVAINILVIGVWLLVSGAPLAGHHAFSSEYDENKVVTLKGKVTKIEWLNPHAKFFVDVVNQDNSVTNWAFELASPNALTREGWNRHTLTVGDAITVSGFAAKSGKNMASTRTVTTADGKALFGGTQGVQ
jgi:hypothetical protein